MTSTAQSYQAPLEPTDRPVTLFFVRWRCWSKDDTERQREPTTGIALVSALHVEDAEALVSARFHNAEIGRHHLLYRSLGVRGVIHDDISLFTTL